MKSIIEILTVVLIVLKVLGIIDWSWWIVLSPFILVFGIFWGAILVRIFMDGLKK